jgi:hypothetical protein
MTLREELVSTPPRERGGGAIAAGRLEYQLNWALLKLLELYRLPSEFLVLLDFQDDVVVCNAEEDPTSAVFYQVKTSSAKWTIRRLLERPRNAQGLSYLGRLYDHRKKFGSAVQGLEFVTNAQFSIGRADGTPSQTKTRMCCVELHEDQISSILAAIATEHGEEPFAEFKALLVFHVSDLPLGTYETHAKGVLADYFEDENPGRAFRIRLIHRALLAELRRKNNNARLPDTFEELIAAKGIGRTAFDSMMRRVVSTNDPQDSWRAIEARLERAGEPLGRLRKLKAEYFRAAAELLDFTNLELNHAYAEIQTLVEHLDDDVMDVRAALETVRAGFRDARFDQDIFGDRYVDALTLHALDDS